MFCLSSGARIWFAYFSEEEIDAGLRRAGFRVEHLERRNPYDTEIANQRIFALGVKAADQDYSPGPRP